MRNPRKSAVIVLAVLILAGSLVLSLLIPRYLSYQQTSVTNPQITEAQVELEAVTPPKSLEKSGLQTRAYLYEFQCQQYSFDLALYKSIYEYYGSINKTIYYDRSPDNWETKYYLQFVQNEEDNEIINTIIDTVSKQIRPVNGDDVVIALTSFVQNLTYDCDKLFSYENVDDHDYETNFPYETLYVQGGVCGDTSILLGKLLKNLGYGAAFLLFDQSNHMAVGVRCPLGNANYLKDGVGYCYIETTGTARIGVKPAGLKEEILDDTQSIIKISEGESFNRIDDFAQNRREDEQLYGENILQFSTCQEISQYKSIHEKQSQLSEYETSLNTLDQEIDPLSQNLEEKIQHYQTMGCEGKVSSSLFQTCQEKYRELNALQLTYENLVDQYNALIEEYNAYYDSYRADVDIFQDLLDLNHSSCQPYLTGMDSAD